MVSISAGKYWIAGATSAGDVYMWDGKKGKNEPPHMTRLHGVKRATSVSVGETHLLIISSLYHPSYLPQNVDDPQILKLKAKNEVDELDEDFAYDDTDCDEALSLAPRDEVKNRPLPSLKSLCEKAAAEYLVEPRSALQLLEIADSLEAHDLRKHCEVTF